MRCFGCPFNDGITEEACVAQNLGCLPTPYDMVEALRYRNVALSCHEVQDIPCRGLSEVLDTAGAELLPYSTWYQKGFEP